MGIDGDVPTPGDYDGDGKMVLRFTGRERGTSGGAVTGGATILQFGTATDVPVPSTYIR